MGTSDKANKAGYKITTSAGQTLPGVYRPSAERGEVSPMQQSSVQSVSPRTEPQMRKQLSRYPYGIRTTGIPHQIFFVEEGPRILSCCQRTMILCADSAQKMRMGRR